MRTRVTELFGIEYPIFAFSHCRDVVAAVSRAGGMGVLGALYFTPEELETELTWIEEHTGGKPYGVDVVMPAKYEGADLGDAGEMLSRLQDMIPEGHRGFVDELLERHGVGPLADEGAGRYLLGWTDATARPQVEVALRHPIALLASALGPPPADVVEQAHRQGVTVAGLASSARHARKQADVGVDIIVAQGTEAGGHTGEISTMVLIPEVVDAVGPDTPEASRDRLLAATSRDTVRSRSWTGRPARMLRTAWTEAWESPESPGTLPMPMQFMLISDALARINRAGAGDLTTFPVGQIVGTMNQVKPTARVMYEMVEEYIETMERLGGLIAD